MLRLADAERLGGSNPSQFLSAIALLINKNSVVYKRYFIPNYVHRFKSGSRLKRGG